MYKNELEVIAQAILNEVEGYEFYKIAAENGALSNKEAFMELANEELKHIEYLRQLFDKLKDNSEDDLKLAFEVAPPSPDIYNWNKVPAEYTSMVMSVFSIGMQMEKDSIKFYEEAKKKTDLKEAIEIFDTLIKWEYVHLEQFSKQYEMYKQQWWDNQNFAPF